MSSGAAILLVDDNAEVGRAMRIAFEVAGHRLDVAATPEEAFSRLAQSRYDALLLDLNFTPGQTAGGEGLACLDRIMADDPAACVVVITAHSGIRIAVAAMQAGARDFVMKPWRNGELVAKVEAAIARGRPIGTPAAVPVGEAAAPALLLGDSPAIARVRDLVRRLGPTAAGVSITGPSGAGRMLVARALHAASADAARPPTVIDLRDAAQWGRLDDATGTVILRHIDRLDDLAQARLVAAWPSGARAIAIGDGVQGLGAALRSLVATVEIAVPPLAARGADALLLARHFLRIAAERHRLAAPGLTVAAERLILDDVWADEARGLALAMERAVLLATDSVIDAAALAPAPAVAPVGPSEMAYDLAGNEKAVIAAALRDNHHNVTQAAAALGLSRGALYRRMERHGL
ncbi:sigma-54-dependent transcriptional regulator [Sphingomonas abietis]|uniref:Response regulator n=1 Tax=Sphingomonas abietis TaxID=3012344 RepID=A0ABY7NLE8_9SPHN|nr:response regulator [Sphingomonas abietis]WBO22324.1 response regulator [Sphingomonas abietis]